jgi:hypothetical protein
LTPLLPIFSASHLGMHSLVSSTRKEPLIYTRR